MTEKEGEIQLIIKAPNQNFEDFTVLCSYDWTVGELKEHLSDEYPSKPDVLDQRLIYSGRLLHNHLHLRDILRYDEDESNVYTLHLVCNANDHSRRSQRQFSSQTWFRRAPTQSQGSNPSATNSTSESTLRHRNAPVAPSTNSNNTVFQPPTAFVPALTVDAQQCLAQMAAMQQMYAHYMNQYMQSLNATSVTGNNPAFPQPASFQPHQNNQNEIPQQRPVNQRLNAQGGQILEEIEEMANRDWLDHLFLCCRFMILFCIIYFYSSPERLMIVIVCAVIAFLYHEGWFVRRNLPAPIAADVHVPRGNRNNVPPPPVDVNNENEPLLVNQDQSANEEVQDVHELEATMDGEDPPHAQNRDFANNNNQIFSPLNFLSAFFSSLIPEPPPPVNIN